MYYVVADKDGDYGVLLIKAQSQDMATSRVNLTDSEKIVGAFTDGEFEAMRTCEFAVISTSVE